MRGRTNENYTRALNVASDVPFLSPDLLHFASRPPHSQNTLFLHSKGNSPVSTIVGYAQSGLKNGATMVTPQFTGIASANIALETLVPQGDDTSDSVNIRVLDAAGRTIEGCEYTWNDWACDYPCWVDGDWTEVTNVSFAPGQGLWVYGASADQALQSAGRVNLEDVVVTLRNGATPTGNPFPVAVDLQDIVAEGEDCSDSVNIRVLDAAGRTIEGCEYTWNDWACDKPCWVDGDWNEVVGVTFAAGQGLWVYGSSADQAIRIPAPEL